MVNNDGTILHKTGHDRGRIHDYILSYIIINTNSMYDTLLLLHTLNYCTLVILILTKKNQLRTFRISMLRRQTFVLN
jgi:hypothetical protein